MGESRVGTLTLFQSVLLSLLVIISTKFFGFLHRMYLFYPALDIKTELLSALKNSFR